MQFQFFWQKYFLREKIKDASRVNIFGTLSLWPHPIPWENELKINHFSGLHLTVFEKKYDSPVMFQRKIKSLSVVLRNWWGSWFKYIWFYIYLECFYTTFNFIGLMFLIRKPLLSQNKNPISIVSQHNQNEQIWICTTWGCFYTNFYSFGLLEENLF